MCFKSMGQCSGPWNKEEMDVEHNTNKKKTGKKNGKGVLAASGKQYWELVVLVASLTG